MPKKNSAAGIGQKIQGTFVTTAQAAQMLGYSHRSGTVNRLIEEGLIEAEHGPGRGLLVYVDSVHAYREHHLKDRHGPGRPRGLQI